MGYLNNQSFDPEWVELIREARNSGLSPEEVMDFFEKNKRDAADKKTLPTLYRNVNMHEKTII
ncbi:anti-repressor SinI family protein [Lentibacillus sp. Marseille-P4043]|uniref:anti-repressor SinI family protein n=1 Tax=Lentibacillus sp. Marseille-P4043 TaxID=2040293 RepID=UPI000D0B5C17|nr:anti-repressor SinI family protein [Lentibacillus sp. Marseille-P4043]